ncbi:hypothetical protein [Shewanella halifaxensis]|uniref:hypothetical protein n=1 Tax=Shewanella halifaxensis TaxID=271098 RepID=UPI0002DE7DF0|nr:hypothetical protein [Shewanella halifaxensis]
MLKKPQTLIVLTLLAALLMLYAANTQFNPESDTVTIKQAPKTVAADLAPTSDSDETQTSFIKVSDERPTKAPEDIRINSLDELMTLFDSLNYNTKSWQEGNREVPRLTFESVSERWQKTSNQIPVQQKKMVFFRLLAPLILVANENILLERRLIESAPLDDVVLQRIAQKYKITKDAETPLTEQQRQTLLEEVDIMPPSLVLAQAAEESGWATSRFTVEGNGTLAARA